MKIERGQIVGESFERITESIEIVERADGEEDRREVKIAISSEAPVARWFGDEILDHSRKSVDLKFIGSGSAPLLWQHDHRTQIGVIENVTLGTDRKLRALVRFSKNAKASEVYDDIRDGIVKNVSVGYRITDYEVIKDDDGEMTGIRATAWRPFEASIVSVPADDSVGVGRSAKSYDERKDVKMPEAQVIDKEAIQREAAETARREAEAEANKRIQAAQEAAEARSAEVGEIWELAARHNMSEEATKHIKDGGTLSSFRGLVITKLGDNAALSNAGDVGLSKRELKDFSVMKLIRASIRGADRTTIDNARLEIEACGEVERREGDRGNGIALPPEVMRNWITPEMRSQLNVMGANQRTLLAGTDTAMIPTDHLASSFIDVLRTQAVLMQAGMRTLPGLSGDVDIPRKATASAVAWISAEHGDSADSEPTFDSVSLSPKDLSVSVPMSRRMRQQSSPAIEGIVRMDIVEGMALGIDLAGLQGSGASGQPTGVANTTGINDPATWAGVNPTWAEVVAMETAIADDNALMGSLAYIGRSNMRGALKTTSKDSGSGQFIMPEGNVLNGYPYYVTNQITDGDLFFGNWQELIMGMWSGLDLVFDDATLAAKNGLYIRAFQTVDFGVRHPVSFALGNDTI